MKKRLNIFTIFLLSFLLAGCAPSRNTALQTQATTNEASADNSIIDVESTVDEDDKGSPPSESSEAPAVPQAENVETGVTPAPEKPAEEPAAPDENGAYISRDDVARYIHLYGHLPSNFITKKEAEKLGWPGGSLEPYAPGMCIGGSRFGNYEGLLPEKEGRFYTECDIDTLGADKRGAKRIVFSNDGLIYYTEDHYESFELLYGEDIDG